MFCCCNICSSLILTSTDLPRYAIGGLSGGEEKDAFWRVVAQCTAGLPEDKPRYVMVHMSINFHYFFCEIVNGKLGGKCLNSANLAILEEIIIEKDTN